MKNVIIACARFLITVAFFLPFSANADFVFGGICKLPNDRWCMEPSRALCVQGKFCICKDITKLVRGSLSCTDKKPKNATNRTSNGPSIGEGNCVWLGFANYDGVKDKESQLHAITKGRGFLRLKDGHNHFPGLCSTNKMKCDHLRSWDGERHECNSSNGYRDSTRIACCIR